MNEFEKKERSKLEIITPCLNEGKNIDNFVNNFKKLLESKNITDYLITIIDDGSNLETRKIYQK